MNHPARPSLLERLSALIMREPGDREQLVELLRSAYSRNLLDADAMSIIEGALTVSEMQVRDIMIPRAQVDFIDINEPVEAFVAQVISTAHSRFPVIDQNRDDVIGVLLAKDLLRYYAGEEEFNVREMLRQAVFLRRRGRVQRARDAAPGSVRAGGEAAQRALAGVPRQPQPYGDRGRRIRRHGGPGHHRGRARADRRRHRG
jgi:Mg2+/Co2+ transporter CorC